jgi:lipoprotein-anchoring transpeptidase ErfK/SrfK
MNPPAARQAAGGPTAATIAKAQPKPVAAPKPKPEPFMIKRILPIDGPIRYGQWFWNEKDVPAGPLVITIDLDARVLSVFRDGYEIGATAVLLGTDAHPTPLGTFPILSKERHNVSEKYGNAPMPWSLRLTRDGVAIHGGHAVELGWASHGCIGAPNEFMKKLFPLASVGDNAIITRGKRAGMGDDLIES